MVKCPVDILFGLLGGKILTITTLGKIRKHISEHCSDSTVRPTVISLGSALHILAPRASNVISFPVTVVFLFCVELNCLSDSQTAESVRFCNNLKIVRTKISLEN